MGVNYGFFFFQAEDGIRDDLVTGVQTCALPIYLTFIPLSQGQFPYALTNSFFLKDGTDLNARYLELYPRVSFLKEKGADLSSHDLSFPQCVNFPLLEDWNPLHGLKLDPRYEPIHPRDIPDENIPFFDGRSLRIHPGFYQKANQGQLPPFFQDYENQNGPYSPDDKHAALSMAVQMEDYAAELSDFMEANCAHGEKLKKEDPLFDSEVATFKKVALPILKKLYPDSDEPLTENDEEETTEATSTDSYVEYSNEMGYFKRSVTPLLDEVDTKARTLENYNIEYAQMPYFARVGETYLTKNPKAVNSEFHVISWSDPKAAAIYQRSEGTIRSYSFAPDAPNELLKSPFALYIQNWTSAIDLIARERQNYRVHDITLSMDPEEYALVSKKTAKNLVVNGAAGTGKTAVLQHRIAYACLHDPSTNFEVVSTNVTMAEEALEIVASLLGKKQGEFDSTISDFFDRILAKGFAGSTPSDFGRMPLVGSISSKETGSMVKAIFDEKERAKLEKDALAFQQAEIKAEDQALSKECDRLFPETKIDSVLDKGEAVDHLLKPCMTVIADCHGISQSYADHARRFPLIVNAAIKTKEVRLFVNAIMGFNPWLFAWGNQPHELTKYRHMSSSFNSVRRAASHWTNFGMNADKFAAQYRFFLRVEALRSKAKTAEVASDFSLLSFELQDRFASCGKIALLDALLSIHPIDR